MSAKGFYNNAGLLYGANERAGGGTYTGNGPCQYVIVEPAQPTITNYIQIDIYWL